MSIFDDIDLAEVSRIVRAVDGFARLVASPDVSAQLRELIDKAADGQAACDAATKLAREERDAADRRIAEATKASADFADFKERTYAEFRQTRADIAENTAALDQRHASLNAREAAISAREQAHTAELERLRAHVGRAA